MEFPNYCSYALIALLAEKGFANAVVYMRTLSEMQGIWRTAGINSESDKITHEIAFKFFEKQDIHININYHPGSKLYFANAIFENEMYQIPRATSDSRNLCEEEAMTYCLLNFVKSTYTINDIAPFI